MDKLGKQVKKEGSINKNREGETNDQKYKDVKEIKNVT